MAGRDDELDALMAEQLDYYRARAAEFDAERRHAESDPGLVAEVAALEQALHRIGPSGAVLELGCGTGNWTERLAEWADRLVAVDAAPEMIDCARAKVEAAHVEFVVADLFAWSPSSRFDVVFFAFVLSHVPPSRFDAFWELVGQALAPQGRVVFIDNGPTAAVGEESVSHPHVPLVRRRLRNGEQHRVIKTLHEPEELRHQLQQRGWNATVQPTGDRFYWALAQRNSPSSD